MGANIRRVIDHPLFTAVFAVFITYTAFHYDSVLNGVLGGILIAIASSDCLDWWVGRRRRA